jgi:hypothetical protein
MLILPKYKEIEVPALPIPAIRLMGQYKFILRDLMGRAVYESDWSQNTILDQGLDLVATTDIFRRNAIGSDGTATNPSQTSLNAELANNGDNLSEVAEYAGAATYAFSVTIRCRHNAGSGTGTIRETGQHKFNNSGLGGLYSRHVITPEIDKGEDQVLDVYYKHTIFPPLGDTILNGVIVEGVTYDTLIKSASLGQTSVNGAAKIMGRNTAGGSSWQQHYAGDIIDNLSVPDGASVTEYGSISKETYVPGNHYVEESVACGLNDANVPGGILRSSTFPFNGGNMQIQYDATDGPAVGTGLPKDGTKLLNFTFRQAWVRH